MKLAVLLLAALLSGCATRVVCTVGDGKALSLAAYQGIYVGSEVDPRDSNAICRSNRGPA